MIIGFTGYKRSGKDTSADYLVRKGFTKLSFASKLKEVIEKNFNFTPVEESKREQSQHISVHDRDVVKALVDCNVSVEDVYGMVRKFRKIFQPYFTVESDDVVTYFVSPRKFMQLFGTDLIREYDDTTWIVDTFLKIGQGDYVISDVRFDNEAEAIKRIGGRIIKIINPSQEGSDGHSSEGGISDHLVDAVVVNDGELVDLYRKIDDVC